MAYFINEDCIACGTCIDECPVSAISEGEIYIIDANICTNCGTCADVCPTGAINPPPINHELSTKGKFRANTSTHLDYAGLT